ncbi:TetR/AcrR family transcriptional regulator, partial [Rhizobium johnstonii]
DEPGGSCVFATLIQEGSRSRGAVRAVCSDGLSVLVDTLADVVPGETDAERRANATTTLSSMIGAVILARAVEERAL